MPVNTTLIPNEISEILPRTTHDSAPATKNAIINVKVIQMRFLTLRIENQSITTINTIEINAVSHVSRLIWLELPTAITGAPNTETEISGKSAATDVIFSCNLFTIKVLILDSLIPVGESKKMMPRCISGSKICPLIKL